MHDNRFKMFKSYQVISCPSPILPGGVYVTFQVSKPEGPVGELRLGPMQRNQRVVFGRIPSCDVVMEHLSISRQHAVRS